MLPEQLSTDTTSLLEREDKLSIVISVMRLDDYYQTYRSLAAYVVFLDKIASVPAAPTPH
jgi:hypothetical protein